MDLYDIIGFMLISERNEKSVKDKTSFKIIVIIILTIILICMCYCYFKEEEIIVDYSEITENVAEENTHIISTTSEIESGLTEQLDLHATYYLEESYVESDEEIQEGESILKYTNDTYLTAPYNCVIIKTNLPEEGELCTNEHYVEICSTDLLAINLSVDETIIDQLTLGQEATIEVEALDNKTYTGNITSISNVASNGKFTVTVEFQNDGDIKIGMTADIVI